jgi:hypothetical protein
LKSPSVLIFLHCFAAASNGKVFDARSKTWGTASRPQPQAAAAAGSSGGGRGSSRQLGSIRGSSAGGLGSSGGGFGSRSTSSGYHVPSSGGGSGGRPAAASGGSSGPGAAVSSAKTAKAAMQADLRVRREPGYETAAATAYRARSRGCLRSNIQQDERALDCIC